MPLVHVCWPIGLTDVGTARGDAAKIPSATRNRVHAAAFGAGVLAASPAWRWGSLWSGWQCWATRRWNSWLTAEWPSPCVTTCTLLSVPVTGHVPDGSRCSTPLPRSSAIGWAMTQARSVPAALQLAMGGRPILGFGHAASTSLADHVVAMSLSTWWDRVVAMSLCARSQFFIALWPCACSRDRPLRAL